jgi:hypothetical protein
VPASCILEGVSQRCLCRWQTGVLGMLGGEQLGESGQELAVSHGRVVVSG